MLEPERERHRPTVGQEQVQLLKAWLEEPGPHIALMEHQGQKVIRGKSRANLLSSYHLMAPADAFSLIVTKTQ